MKTKTAPIASALVIALLASGPALAQQYAPRPGSVAIGAGQTSVGAVGAAPAVQANPYQNGAGGQAVGVGQPGYQGYGQPVPAQQVGYGQQGQPVGAAPAAGNQGYGVPGQADRTERQAEGDYMPIDRANGLSFGATQDAWSAPFENMAPGMVSPGVTRFRWSSELVMPITTRETFLTTIVLPSWEKVRDVYIGEKVYFEAAIIGKNSVAIRAAHAGLDTTVTIVGESDNLYNFYVRSQGPSSSKLTDVTVFVDAAPSKGDVWFSGSSRERAPVAPAPGAAPVPVGAAEPAGAIAGATDRIPAGEMHFVHKMYEVHPGDSVVAPETVYTNGKWTFFSFGARASSVDRPVVYKVVDGVESIVNTRTIGERGEILVAEAVGEFTLRNGSRQVCVKLAGDRAGR